MEKKSYQAPELKLLGTVRELTALVSPPTECSALEDFSTADAVCEHQIP